MFISDIFPYIQFEVFEAAKVHMVVFRVITPCSLVSGKQWFVVTPLSYCSFLYAHSVNVMPIRWHRESRIIWYAPEWYVGYHIEQILCRMCSLWGWNSARRSAEKSRIRERCCYEEILTGRGLPRDRRLNCMAVFKYCPVTAVDVWRSLCITDLSWQRSSRENIREKHWDIL